MGEIKNCLPENARKHFINLLNLRLEAETASYRKRLSELRLQVAARNQGRTGWQAIQEWNFGQALSDSLAIGYLEDAVETCRLYDIPLTTSICNCLLKAVENQLDVHYRHALQAHGHGLKDLRVPASVVQQGNSRKVMPRIRVMLE